MIRVDDRRTGRRHRLAVTGHAGYGERGKDIVCAGVSALSFALLGYLHQAGSCLTQVRADSGDLLIEAAGDSRTAGAFEMALVGYREIAKKYPHHVEVYYVPR